MSASNILNNTLHPNKIALMWFPAVLTQSKNHELAQAFIAYVLSTDGQVTLKKWDFLPVK
jgi:ABC-type Fe3+ transport system substrate-binding protein